MTWRSGSPQPAARGASWLPAIGNAIADLLFPPRCVVCRRSGSWLCEACLAAVERIRPPICYGCGLPFPPHTERVPSMRCSQCQASPVRLDGVRSCAFHTGPLRQAIHELKYEGLRSLAGPLGQLMSLAWPELAPTCSIDAIVPMPLHTARERERGYNQSALLARAVGGALDRPVVEHMLVRIKATRPQVGLSVEERRANVAGAFRCRGADLAGKNVLLIDDVLTTGATLAEAAAALQATGAGSVWAYTLARAK